LAEYSVGASVLGEALPDDNEVPVRLLRQARHGLAVGGIGVHTELAAGGGLGGGRGRQDQGDPTGTDELLHDSIASWLVERYARVGGASTGLAPGWVRRA